MTDISNMPGMEFLPFYNKLNALNAGIAPDTPSLDIPGKAIQA
ncbi:hypothetical protein UXO16_20380 [Enterobacter hormaechei]|uniref:Uncharacterized protein n=1 Tax=Enterobacter ludwigii TaxID=299767 RepID=A0AAX3LI31_9ENTR|nr:MULTISPECIES: hypothetical protein [Enterobacteriaceae]MDV0977410.1 hypothetical protein [Klebsiella pneumoniae]WCE15975.1 hypothetical protein PHA72_26950 [Enterobacter ludwigii]